MEPYIDKFFDSVIEVARNNSNEYTKRFVAGLFPDFYGKEE